MAPRPRRRISAAAHRENLAHQRGLPFVQAYRAATSRSPGSWNSLTTGLSAIAALFLVHAWLLLTQDNPPSAVGIALLPLGGACVTHGWVYGRALVMLLGIAVAFCGAAAPFWIMNAT